MAKLVSFSKSSAPGKKYTAVVEKDGRKHTIHFGDSTMKDYTLFSAVEREARKRAYLSRHRSREDWDDPTTPGFWSRHVLWGPHPSVSANLNWVKGAYHL